MFDSIQGKSATATQVLLFGHTAGGLSTVIVGASNRPGAGKVQKNLTTKY